MIQKDKELLLKNSIARLYPYKVKCNVYKRIGTLVGLSDYGAEIDYGNGEDTTCEIKFCKPYLRPLSSMTEEEMKSLPFPWTNNFGTISSYQESEGFVEIIHDECSCIIDWLNKNMFDYRGLIPNGLAISTEEFNPYK